MRRLLLLLALSATCMLPMNGNSQQHTTITLQSMRNHQRALLVFANGNNQLAESQLTVAADHIDGFKERDLLLVGIQGSDPAVPTAILSAADDVSARKRFHVASGQFTVILIGKDGGEKLHSHQPVSWDKLQATIDAMPMRQDEMRPKGPISGTK